MAGYLLPDAIMHRADPKPNQFALPVDGAVRLVLAGVALAAGITGLVLLALPADSSNYFSWGLDPPPLAALIGGSYVASLLVFGMALRASWVEVRGLVVATLALTLPMLAATFVHLDAFDFGRWQAWGWVLLFLASPVSFGAVLIQRGRPTQVDGQRPAAWARLLAGVMCVGLLTLAVLLWIEPARFGLAVFPFELPPLGGRVLGSWMSFLAFLAGWAATHTRTEGWIPSLGLVAFTAGALLGALRTIADLASPWPYLAGLLVLTTLGWLLFREADGSHPAADHDAGRAGGVA